jgi:hypothetical protein
LADGAGHAALVFGGQAREPPALDAARRGGEHGQQLDVLKVPSSVSSAYAGRACPLEARDLVVDAHFKVIQHVLPSPPSALPRATVRARNRAVVLGQQQLLQLRHLELRVRACACAPVQARNRKK